MNPNDWRQGVIDVVQAAAYLGQAVVFLYKAETGPETLETVVFSEVSAVEVSTETFGV